MSASPPEFKEAKKPEPVGPMFATVIIVLIFLIGGVYFLVKQEQRVRELKMQSQLPTNA